MNKTLLLLLSTFSLSATAQHKLEKIWETKPIIAVPESVLDDGKGTLYVSLINGSPWALDATGGVARLKPDGTGYDSTFITGLHSPKGLAIFGDRLYVADVHAVVVVDLKKGAIEKNIAWEEAQGLNDLTVDADGIVYVSDSKSGKVWRIENDNPTLYLENLEGLNGLKAAGTDLIIAAGKSFVKADKDKKITNIASLPQGGDGIEPVGKGDYLVTSWSGWIFYVHANGKVETLLNTSAEKINAADIGYDAKKRIVYVPTFNAKTVAAYKLK
ncbi:ATP-binding protein [Chitinophaga horti]|uniref:ATP-binding protein n=1 Tax=Chitinophaga horti TaxID=2920382 RepID=A0ABY6J5X4_9BACT|nr:ATP-binding protein [Chitinophaga horti]UYQ95022.1 ATP-binding protein [Chitinophaga horti]